MDDNNYYCVLEGEDVECLDGINNTVSVCLYLIHYLKVERTSTPDYIAMKKSSEGQRLDNLLKGYSIGGRFKNI
jgi:hypothetical protein